MRINPISNRLMKTTTRNLYDIKLQEAKNNLDLILPKIGGNRSNNDRLEVAKNLYFQKKYFASAYEFSTLLKEGYEPDICYEYMGDIAGKLNSYYYHWATAKYVGSFAVVLF